MVILSTGRIKAWPVGEVVAWTFCKFLLTKVSGMGYLAPDSKNIFPVIALQRRVYYLQGIEDTQSPVIFWGF
jgi:hypothetical protein